ncbi:cysteine/serine-rich nuclear protein 1 [Anomaloglossus baeobatrachus]|uniref:cysteine/serine-rich nuclear protein 1 n=1 Tax=Anomaloglossus baeobatrachus TaxID=238106 RepID=UPI003F4FB90B
MSGLLKRKYEALEDDFTYSSSSSSPSSSATSSGGETDDEFNYSSRPALSDFTPISILKTAKRVKKNNVHFDRVIVFYFQRCQGFTSVPSRGGCTLGMRQKHSYSRQFTLEEFSREQLNRRREKLKEYLKEEKLLALKNMFTKNGTVVSEKANNLSIDDICDEDIDMTNVEVEDGFNPLIYSAKKRRRLLKRKGVKKIDKSEKHELNEIRKSREQCGCDCQDSCEPETCGCILAGIKCQRDHSTFPCGCTKDGCGNQNGRVEFNSSRVQTHFYHTVMKLELEEKSQNDDDDGNDKPKLSCNERLNPFACSSMASNEDQERTASTTTSTTSDTAPYHFNTDLEPAGENSCSSDTTDSSSSSGQSEGSESPFELASSSDKSEPDFEEDYLARILHFNDSEYEDNSTDCQDNLSFFHTTDFFCDKVYESLYTSEKSDGGFYSSSNSLSNISKCVDENANQGADCFTDNEISMAISTDSTEPLLKNYMDISLSSEAFEIPDETEYNFGPLYNSLNEYENLCSQQCLVTLLPGFTPAADTTASFLESLISSSESCNDNQYLEDALKSPSPFESLIA